METSIDCQNVNPRWLTTKILISLAGKSANWQTSQNRMSLGIWISPRRNTNTKTQKQQQWQAANGAFSQKIVSLFIHRTNTKTKTIKNISEKRLPRIWISPGAKYGWTDSQRQGPDKPDSRKNEIWTLIRFSSRPYKF